MPIDYLLQCTVVIFGSVCRGSSKGVAAAVARTQSNQAQAAVSTVEDVPSKPGGGGAYFASQAANDEDDFDPRGAFSATSKYLRFSFSLMCIMVGFI